jgi:hypothetical protein
MNNFEKLVILKDTMYSFSKFPFLKELGLTEINPGVYRNGEWVGDGPEEIAYNPHDNTAIAAVRTATLD